MKLKPDENQVVRIQGHLFRAYNIRVKQMNGVDVLRFEAQALGEDLKGTGYDGGTYGNIVGYRHYDEVITL